MKTVVIIKFFFLYFLENFNDYGKMEKIVLLVAFYLHEQCFGQNYYTRKGLAQQPRRRNPLSNTVTVDTYAKLKQR
jgi:hypothetical protein